MVSEPNEEGRRGAARAGGECAGAGLVLEPGAGTRTPNAYAGAAVDAGPVWPLVFIFGSSGLSAAGA
jgi:hypothetical protein